MFAQVQVLNAYLEVVNNRGVIAFPVVLPGFSRHLFIWPPVSVFLLQDINVMSCMTCRCSRGQDYHYTKLSYLVLYYVCQDACMLASWTIDYLTSDPNYASRSEGQQYNVFAYSQT